MDKSMKAKRLAMEDLHGLMSDVEKKNLKKGGEPTFSVKRKMSEPEVGETEEHEASETPEEEMAEHPETLEKKSSERDGKVTHADRADPGDDVGEQDESAEQHDTDTIDADLEKFLLRKGKRGVR